MIDLMLKRNSQQTFGLDLLLIATFVESYDLHLFSTAYLSGEIDNAQAALFPNQFTF